MKTFRMILEAQVESVKSVKMISKDRMTKEIVLFKKPDGTFEIVADTESDAPTTVRCVKSTLAWTKIDDEQKALKMYDKKVAAAKKKGWKEK